MTRLHSWAVERFGVLIWVAPIAAVSALIYFLGEILDIPRLSVYWGSIWAAPSVFFTWAAIDTGLDWRANQRGRKRPELQVTEADVKTAQWVFRDNTMIALACISNTAGGLVSIFQLGPTPSNLAVALLFAGGAIMLTLGAWDRSSRWDVLRIQSRHRLRQKELK